MERRTTSWHSPNLNMEMPLVAYGHAGQTLLMLPTAAADYLEYERFHLVDAIRHHIESGKIRAFSVNSVNRWSLLNEKMPPNLKAELLMRFDRYLVEEVLPLIRQEAGADARPITTGASLGAFLAANAYFKHPDLFRGVIALSGSYDVRSYLKDFHDDNVYFNNPADYLRPGQLRSPGTQSTSLRHSALQRNSPHARSLGTRCRSRLALVAEDAAVHIGQDRGLIAAIAGGRLN